MEQIKKRTWLSFLIIMIGCATAIFLADQEEEKHFPETAKKALSVEILTAKTTNYRIQVPAWGFVEPQDTIDIRTEVSGKIVEVPDYIFTGAIIKQGELLFSIDAREYEDILAEATAASEQAQQAFKIEKGLQNIAKTEWELLENSNWQEYQDKSLALREPQLKEREAEIKISRARQAQAALNVERTQIKAPCKGVIIAEYVAEGQVINTDYMAMKIACTDCYHILASYLPEYSLDYKLHKAVIDIGSNIYKGVVKAELSQINEETRHKQVLVEFEGERVILGSYVSLILPGLFFRNVFVIPKEALRAGNTVWIINESNKLEIRNVAVIAQDTLYVIIDEGLKQGDQIILSHIASPLQGMAVHKATHTADNPEKRIGDEEQSK